MANDTSCSLSKYLSKHKPLYYVFVWVYDAISKTKDTGPAEYGNTEHQNTETVEYGTAEHLF